MILPPEEIKIKRKRTDEPVDILHIQEPLGKRQRCATNFVFCRQVSVNSTVAATGPAVLRTVHTVSSFTKYSPLSLVVNSNQKSKEVPKTNHETKPRHFHIHRPNKTNEYPNVAPLNRKRKADTVFVERKLSSIRKLTLNENAQTLPLLQLSSKANSYQSKMKPGLPERSSKTPAKTPSLTSFRNVRLPSGDMIPWDVTSQELVAEMQAYTLSEINKNINDSEKERYEDNSKSQPSTNSASSVAVRKQTTRFKPKVPALRYKDRHRDPIGPDSDIDSEITSHGSIEDDDEDWIVEKYSRIPIEEAQTENFVNYGYLVLDSQAEIEEFYQEDIVSEEEDEEEDEDENAENHYTADYPDEDVESDDEFDRSIYNDIHSLDEFEADDDYDDDALSNDDHDVDEKRKYPWMRKTLAQKAR